MCLGDFMNLAAVRKVPLATVVFKSPFTIRILDHITHSIASDYFIIYVIASAVIIWFLNGDWVTAL